jgi:7-cyano-7-deazaguanine reductase
MAEVLGQQVAAPTRYAPEVLEAIRRQGNSVGRRFGVDVWHLYELSWLISHRGGPSRPSQHIGVLEIPADSPATVESKSLKLYLNSLNFEAFSSDAEAVARIQNDLYPICDVRPALQLYAPTEIGLITQEPMAELLDEQVAVDSVAVVPDSLADNESAQEVASLMSHRLRSLCPVTAQPDWATIVIHHQGRQINREGLLAYIDSFREHQDFHEQCIEAIFGRLVEDLAPDALTVTGYYQRRGGIDITPQRSTQSESTPIFRMGRQ